MSARYECPDVLKQSVAALLTLACVHSGAVEAADCLVELGRQPPELHIEYDPYALRPALGATIVTIVNPSSSRCAVDLELSFSGHRQQYIRLPGIGADAEFWMTNRGAGKYSQSRKGFAFTVNGHETREVELVARLRPGGFPPPGVIREEVHFQLKEANSNRVLSDSFIVGIVADVAARAQVNIAGTQGQFGTTPRAEFVNFGALRTGSQRDVYVQVRSNSRYMLTLESEHGGQLLHTETPSLPGIPYTMIFRGETTTLAAPFQRQMPSPENASGVSIPLSFRIGEMSSRFAGDYQDVIEVSVDALY